MQAHKHHTSQVSIFSLRLLAVTILRSYYSVDDVTYITFSTIINFREK